MSAGSETSGDRRALLTSRRTPIELLAAEDRRRTPARVGWLDGRAHSSNDSTRCDGATLFESRSSASPQNGGMLLLHLLLQRSGLERLERSRAERAGR